MNLGKFAVERPVAVTMRIAALVLLGYICLLRLPVDLLPRVDVPTVSVSVSWPNTAPEEMESQIARPLEEAVGTVRGLRLVSSTSTLGSANVRIQFDYGVNVDQAAVDVLQLVQRAQAKFPVDPTITQPQVFKFDPSALPIQIFGVRSTKMGLTALRDRMTNQLSPMVESSGGVASVTITGGNDRAIMVNVDPTRLTAHHLTLDAISRRLQQENIALPAGIAIQGKTQYNIRSVGYFANINEIKKVPVGVYNGNTVTLDEIADVVDAQQDITSYTRMNEEPCVVMAVTKQSTSNTIETSQNVDNALKKIEASNPDLVINSAYDQSKFIKNSIDDLKTTALIGAVLAIIIITMFLRNLRSTFVVALSIPTSIISTFSLLYFCGFTLNTISLSGLALASGLIVDDAIVVLENIYRHIERDQISSREAAIVATKEIFSAVVASTFTVMIVFLPLLLLGGQSGQVFTQFALVVIFSIAVSLLDATSIVPMLASRMIKERDVMEEAHPELRPPERRNLMTNTFDWFGRWFDSFDESYRKTLKKALHARWVIVIIGVASVVFAALLWPQIGVEYFPQTDSGNISLRLKLPIGTPVDITNASMKKLEAVLAKEPDVDVIIAGAGANIGLRGVGNGVPQEGSATIQLKLNRKLNTQDEIKLLQKKLNIIPGGRVYVQPFDIVQNILGNSTGFSVDVYGQDLPTLTKVSKDVLRAMTDVPGLQNVDVNVQDALPEIQWKVDRDKAQALGVSFEDVANAVASATNGQLSSYYQENGFQYQIFVQVPRNLRLTAAEIARIPITGSVAASTASGSSGASSVSAGTSSSSVPAPITVGQVATAVLGTGPNQINRQNRQRVINVGGNVTGRAEGDIQTDVMKALAKVNFVSGTYYDLGQQQLQRQRDYSGLGLAVFLAISLIYMLLATQFESFVYPLVVLCSVPLCGIGMVLALFLTGRPFGVTAFIGLLMLIGIVVKNGILLVDYTNHLRGEGMEREEAILRAGPTRLRPILMTTLAAILGMLPLAIGIGSGSELYVPLATAVIGGLATSTLLTLFVVPTVYTMFDDLLQKFGHTTLQSHVPKHEAEEGGAHGS